MGLLPIYEPRPHDKPPEPNDDGCPGSFYRSRFVVSLIPYERVSYGEGGLNENLRLSRCQDPLVIEAIQTLEIERGRAHAHNVEKTR